MFKGIDIRYATRPTEDDAALMDLRKQLRIEEDRHHALKFKLTFLGERLQAALDAGRADNAMDAVRLFSRLKEDLALRFQTIIALNAEIARIDPRPASRKKHDVQLSEPASGDALMDRVLARIEAITQPNAQPC